MEPREDSQDRTFNLIETFATVRQDIGSGVEAIRLRRDRTRLFLICPIPLPILMSGAMKNTSS